MSRVTILNTVTMIIMRSSIAANCGLVLDSPDLTGCGLGAEFVSACVEYAVKHHRYRGEYVRLGVAVFNQRAIKAYERAGFQIFGNTVGEISGKTFECVYMRKRLCDFRIHAVEETDRYGERK